MHKIFRKIQSVYKSGGVKGLILSVINFILSRIFFIEIKVISVVRRKQALKVFKGRVLKKPTKDISALSLCLQRLNWRDTIQILTGIHV